MTRLLQFWEGLLHVSQEGKLQVLCEGMPPPHESVELLSQSLIERADKLCDRQCCSGLAQNACPIRLPVRGFHCVEKEGVQHQAKLGTFVTEARIFFP